MRKFLWALLAGIYSLSLYSAGNPSDEINAGGPNSALRPVSFVSPILPPLEPTSNIQHMSASGGQLSTAEDVAAVWLIKSATSNPLLPWPLCHHHLSSTGAHLSLPDNIFSLDEFFAPLSHALWASHDWRACGDDLWSSAHRDPPLLSGHYGLCPLAHP